MKFTVVWKPAVERQLPEIWLEAADRQDVPSTEPLRQGDVIGECPHFRLQSYLNAGIAVGRPTRIKKRAKACEKCSRNGDSKHQRSASESAW